MFIAHAKRSAVERIHEVKNAMVAGIWANSNYDDGEDTRKNLLAQVDSFVDSAIASIYGQEVEEEEIDTNNPFFAAMKLPEIDHSLERDRVGELP